MQRLCHFLFVNLLVSLILPAAAKAQVIVGPGSGGNPEALLIEPAGSRTVPVFDPAFLGGVSVTLGDVNGDGTVDIVAGAGPGGGPHVRVFNGTDLSELASFYAFDPGFRGGVHVAAGDVDGDGRSDIIVGAGAGGGPHVRVFSGLDLSELASFYAYSAAFTGGVTVAAGDVDGDGRADIVTGAGAGGGPHVRVFSGADLRELASFYAYDADFGGGVSVAAGDFDGDGLSDIATGAGPGGGPHVRVFSGLDLGELASFYGYDPALGSGVNVAAGDIDGDARVDLILGAGPGGGLLVRILNGLDFSELDSFFAPESMGIGISIGSVGDVPGLRFTSAAATTFTTGSAGTFTVTTAGHPVPAITSSGALPAGVTLTDNGDGTATLAGTPDAGTGRTYPVTFSADNGGPSPVTQPFTLTVTQAPAITSAATTSFTVGVAGTFTVISTGSPLPTITIGGATLPSAVTFENNGDGTATLSGTPASGTGGTYVLTFTAVNGTDPVATQTFTLQVLTTLVNDPPALDAIADPAAFLEDAGLQTVNLSGISAGPGESAQPLQVTASSNNTGLIPNPTVTYASPAATGSLSYTPVVNAFGSAVITVTVTDGGLDNNLATPGDNGSVVRTFTVTVTSVNDAPSFTVGANQTALEDAGPQTVANFATSISPGPGESDAVTFAVTNNTNPALFIAGPAISATGTLTYTTAANQHGVATITVQLTDNGGTANGGVNQSATQQFTITVTPVNDAPVAAAKAFTAQANLLIGYTINLAANGSGDVTDADNNDPGFTTQAFTLTSLAALSCAGCVATITSGPLGTFTFEPPPGQTGTFTLTYRVTDNGNPMPGVQSVPGAATGQPGVITITVNGPVVWFVDSTAPAGGNGTWTGTNAKAFQTLAQADAANLAGDRIFILNNNVASLSYAGNLALLAGERLTGQGVIGASFDTVLLGGSPPAGTAPRPLINGVRPTLQGTTTLADGVTVTGVNFAPSAAIPAMSAGALVATVPITIDQVNVSGPTGTSALSLTNVTASGAGAINVSNASFSNTSAAGVLVSGGNVPIAFASTVTITSNAGRSIDIQGRSGGTVTFSGPITDTGQGVFLNANTGSTINFTGGLSLSTGTSPGFTATGGGTVSATQNNTTILNTITTTTGTALNVAGTTIGASGLTFRSISAGTAAGGPVDGILLNNTGASGSLIVQGTNAANSGGVIQFTTAAGISLTNTLHPQFAWINIHDIAHSGIDGQQVTNFTLTNSTIDNVGTAVAGQYNESNVAFNDAGAFTSSSLSGTVTITNNTLSNARRHGIQIENGTGTIANLTISNNVLTSSTSAAASLGTAILVLAQGSATLNAHVTTGTIASNTISNFPSGEGILVGGGSGNGSNNTSSTLGANGTPISITGNAINGGASRMGSNAIRAAFNGQQGVANFSITNNGTAGSPITNIQGQGISVFMGGSVTGTTTINNNFIVANQTLAAGTQGLAVQIDDGPAALGTSAADYNVIITNNSVSAYEGNGIRAIARASLAKMDVTIQNNTVGTPILANRNGIRIDSGSAAGDVAVCLAISGNTSAGSGVNAGIGLRKQGTVAATNDFGIVGLAPSPTTGANAAARVNTDNPAGAGVDILSGDNFTSCTITP